MENDWCAIVRDSNRQAPTPATSTTLTNMTEPTWQLLDRGAHHFQDSNPHVPVTRDALDAKCKQSKAFEREWKDSSKPGRPIRGSFLYVIQQTAALKRAATYGTLTLRTSTQNVSRVIVTYVHTHRPHMHTPPCDLTRLMLKYR
ncbi:hypothetical protein V8C86DRAFT_3118926 [Haematococcus lacustris]